MVCYELVYMMLGRRCGGTEVIFHFYCTTTKERRTSLLLSLCKRGAELKLSCPSASGLGCDNQNGIVSDEKANTPQSAGIHSQSVSGCCPVLTLKEQSGARERGPGIPALHCLTASSAPSALDPLTDKNHASCASCATTSSRELVNRG